MALFTNGVVNVVVIKDFGLVESILHSTEEHRSKKKDDDNTNSNNNNNNPGNETGNLGCIDGPLEFGFLAMTQCHETCPKGNGGNH